jgi:hypothetical protein
MYAIHIFYVLYFIPITYPLRVSAPTGHLQADYIISYILRSYLTTIDPLFYLFLGRCFWRFVSVVSLYVVDMLTCYPNTLLEYFVT